MRIERSALSTLLVLVLVLVASTSSALDLGTLPGLNPAQVQVGTAIDVLCPKLAQTAERLNSAQADLLARCTDMKAGSLGLSSAGLADVLSKVTSPEGPAQGSTIIDSRSIQFRGIGARLAALRLGASGVSVSGLNLDIDGKTLSVGRVLGFGEPGGGASADSEGRRLGAFVNGVGSFGSKDPTSLEAGFDFHTAGVTAGADYRLADNFIAGLALSYLRTDASIFAPIGSVDIRSYGVSLYGTYYVGALYVDGLAGFTWHDYDTARRIIYGPASGAPGAAVNRTANGDTDGRQGTLNLGVGYDVRIGGSTITPYGRAEYLRLTVDGYTEHGAAGLDLTLKEQTVESLLTVLGTRLTHAFSTPIGVLVPQVRGEWRHEFLNNARSIRAKFANDPFNVVFSIPTDRPDRDYFAVGAAVSAVLRKGVAGFIDYETLLGFRDVVSHGFTAGVRIEF
jgi:outer membrane lipase/esterase